MLKRRCPPFDLCVNLSKFGEALQKFAYKHAFETLSKPTEQPKPKRMKHENSYSTYNTEESQEFTVKVPGPLLSEVVAYPYSFSFRLCAIRVSYKTSEEPDHWHFEAEEKIYKTATTVANYPTTEAALKKRRNRLKGSMRSLVV